MTPATRRGALRGEGEPARDPLVVSIGQRVKALRARKGMPRRALSLAADVSERHLGNLETGVGNVSVLVLKQIADALGCPLAALVGDETTTSPEWLLIRELLHDRNEADLTRARHALAGLFRSGVPLEQRMGRIALIGLRGAGKSTLGRGLADALGRPFVELGAEVARMAGCTPTEILDLYGPAAYRRYEGRALDAVLASHSSMVLATPGGIVSDPGSLGVLMSNCFTVWLRASPAEHMSRVLQQGDFRPMAGNREAMADLKAILASRTPFYEKADLAFDTSDRTLAETLDGLLAALRLAQGAATAP